METPGQSDVLLEAPPKQKRSSVACRRCRRLRAKCVKEEGGQGLCRGCIDAGVPNECQFLPRGMSAIDRAPRPSTKRKRQRRDNSPDPSPGQSSSHPIVNGICTACHQQVPAQPQPLDDLQLAQPEIDVENLLPPQQELIDGCEWFFSTYFQLGFLHKPTFMHRLINTPSSISPFLLLSMLSISARFTPSLVQRYKGPANAASVFAKRAQQLAGQEILETATLERAQGFFLCSIWSWGSGYRDRSWIFLGIAARMVSILKLSQEESYNLPLQPRVEQVIEAEVSRRTWWVIFMSDNLLSSGCGRPISFDLEKVTIPLPLDEDQFYFGQQGPTTVLPGTRAKPSPNPHVNSPAIDPQLQKSSSSEGSEPLYGSGVGDRSLYGNLITIADIWARVARSAMERTKDVVTSRNAPIPNASSTSTEPTVPPWLPESDFHRFLMELSEWEVTLGPRQSWSQSNLLAYQQKSLDMGFRGIFLIMHLSHIVLRRSYLPMLAHDVQKSQTQPQKPASTSVDSTPAPPTFWETMVQDMFRHALQLIELVESWVPTRSFSKGCTPMMGFSLFMAGSVLCYLRRWKWLCPSLWGYTDRAVDSALGMIRDISTFWPPMGGRWYETLEAVFEESSEMEDGASTSPIVDEYAHGHGHAGYPQQSHSHGQSGMYSYPPPHPHPAHSHSHSNRTRGARTRGPADGAASVEGLGRAAEEDLEADEREGMYRHRSVEEDERESSRREESHSPRERQGPPGPHRPSLSASASQVQGGRERRESLQSVQPVQRQSSVTIPSPQIPRHSNSHSHSHSQDTHMLYSLATAASMDHKASSTPATTSHPTSHHTGHPASLPPTSASTTPSTTAIFSHPHGVAPHHSGIGVGVVGSYTHAPVPAVDWQHFQTDLNLLLQDDLGVHLEYGGDGWAF